MAELGNPKKTIEILQKYDIHFAKKYGQNFLIDPLVLEKIVRSAEITSEDVVLEIGPGIGTLTQYLAERAGHVVAVEIDTSLKPVLSETLGMYDNVTVIFGDILKQDLFALSRQYAAGRPFKVVANLPYYITTPIVMGILEEEVPVSSLTIMIQKEVAIRMQAGPGTKDYGALSLAVAYYASPYLCANVPPHCFMPRPAVSSAVIRLTRYDHPPVEVKDPHLMFAIIRAAFNERRKTLVNGLKNGGFDKEAVLTALQSLGWSETLRGETLTLSDFARLSDAMGEMGLCIEEKK